MKANGLRQAFNLYGEDPATVYFFGPSSDPNAAFGTFTTTAPAHFCYCEWGPMVRGEIWVWTNAGGVIVYGIEVQKSG